MMKPRRIPQPDRTATAFLPPPDGLNVADPAGHLAPTDALQLVNAIRGESGLRPRLGYREHATGLPSSVRTVIPFTGSQLDGSYDRLFAACVDGIWEVTNSTASPTRVLAFSEQSPESGWGTFTQISTPAERYLVYADEINGYCLYTESTNTWSMPVQGSDPGQINGANPRTFAHVCAWKNRLWFTQRNSGVAWYLPVGVIADTVKKIEFGNRFKSGGQMVGLWSWTGDGGAGIDDHLVAVSTAGDVLIYAGSDPDTAGAFAMRGVWSAGAVPAGRRIASDDGGDLLLLTALGLFPISRLASGSDKLDPATYSTRKIAPLLTSAMGRTSGMLGWSVRLDPGDGALLVTVPTAAGASPEQYAMAMGSKGWSRYTGLPILCCEAWRGKMYFGTADGRVCVRDGYADGIMLDCTGATDISVGWLSSYSDLGSPRQKRVQLVRPEWLTDGTPPTFSARIRYGFDLAALPAAPAFVAPAGSWDSGTWDSATWAESTGTERRVVGAAGMGTHAAVEVVASCRSRATLTGVSATWDQGGIL